MASKTANYTPQQAAAEGLGWVDPNNPNYGKAGFIGQEDPAAPSAPPATPSAPANPAGTGDPNKAYTPSLGPLTVNPTTGQATHDPAQAPPVDPTTPPERIAAPVLGPLVDHGGTATHDPELAAPPPVPPPWESAPPEHFATSSAPNAPAAGPVSVDPAGGSANAGAGADLYRDMLIKQMGQDEIPNVNDAAIKAQLDPYRAEQTRAMRDEIRSGAEQAFAGHQDFGSPEEIAAAERAGQNTGLRASDLVGRELTARRQQISDALGKYGTQLNADQNRALTEKLAQIDATLKSRGLDIQQSLGQQGIDLSTQELALKKYLGDKDIGIQLSDQDIRRLGLAQTGALGNRELDIRDKLGQMGINADMVRALLADQQFRETLGLNIGTTQADLNRSATIAGMGGGA